MYMPLAAAYRAAADNQDGAQQAQQRGGFDGINAHNRSQYGPE